ncbi:hypothetical protein [Wielerella bovis]|uniref:hypothetical protein n=1 Tax=Wielerella bovis TaxID=2917790 RepID=UPI0020190A4D|nr:hypothetical protein [Wielerella bovis]ULJ66644.1 hypothetical protein MIS31_10405 [Wielerella bovis]
MSEPMVTPVVAGTAVSWYFLGMPVEAVALGALASAAVLMREPPKSISWVVSCTVMGGLLGGGLAPVLGGLFLDVMGSDFAHLSHFNQMVLYAGAPIVVGSCWQFLTKLVTSLYPSIEKHFDEIVAAVVGFILRRPKK